VKRINILNAQRKATHNRKFVQKWLTVVQLRFFVNYLVLCGATTVLQAMPFLHKLANRVCLEQISEAIGCFKRDESRPLGGDFQE
jgi:hypothetical protein